MAIKVTVKEDEIPVEVIAKSIMEISNGVKKIRAGRLNEKALEVLLCVASGVGVTEVRRILNSLESLEAIYLKPKKKD